MKWMTPQPTLISCIVVLLACGVTSTPAQEIANDDQATVHPLIAIRKLPKGLLIEGETDDGQAVSGIPIDVFKQISKSEHIVEYLKTQHKTPEETSFADLFHTAKIVSTSKGWNKTMASGALNHVKLDFPPMGKDLYLDNDVLLGLTTSELFPADSDSPLTIKHFNYRGADIGVLQCEADAFKTLKEAYTSFSFGPSTEIAEWSSRDIDLWSDGMTRSLGILGERPSLEKAVTLTEGSVSFGKPQVATAASKNLNVPPVVGEPGDVVWIDLDLTIAALDLKKVETLVFYVEVTPATVLSLALVPAVDPKLRAISHGLAIPLQGYQGLKPQIHAGGLRESKLFWALSSKAIQKGTHNFSVVARIPPQVETISVSRQVIGRTKDVKWGRWTVANGVVFATPRPDTVPLPLE